MKVGDTFFFDGIEFSIKNIDTESTEKFPTGRVDASKFIGTHDDPENPRTIQRGRPKMFNFSDVAEILGETFTTTEVASDAEMTGAALGKGARIEDQKPRARSVRKTKIARFVFRRAKVPQRPW